MLAGPKQGRFSAQIEPPRSDRVIADSWRGLYGSDLFSSMLPAIPTKVLRNGTIWTNKSTIAVFYRKSGGTPPVRRS
jgi:hypothetical protein